MYASFGRAFETPTFAEAGYRADGGAGLAFDLRPVTSDNAEIGAKWRREGLQAQLAVFQSDSDGELAVATSVGGRTTYQNIDRSRRRGAELSGDWQFAGGWSLGAAYSYLDARFTSAFLGCSTRCARPDTPVAAGTRIPRRAAQQRQHVAALAARQRLERRCRCELRRRTHRQRLRQRVRT
ncbi:MAG: TonB-dependent receptor domain-containing protein, partial [Luteimonas sp.]